MKKALIIVDFQNDFCQNGSLEITDAEHIIPYINRLIISQKYDEIIFTQDYHPLGHCSFASTHHKKEGEIVKINDIEQILWPDHCVEGTWGACFHLEVKSKDATFVLKKGTSKEVDSYSAFFDQKKGDTGLTQYLKNKGIEIIEVVGLALDYCVKYTCIDAVHQGFTTKLHLQGTKPVVPNEQKNTISELLKNGIFLIK